MSFLSHVLSSCKCHCCMHVAAAGAQRLQSWPQATGLPKLVHEQHACAASHEWEQLGCSKLLVGLSASALVYLAQLHAVLMPLSGAPCGSSSKGAELLPALCLAAQDLVGQLRPPPSPFPCPSHPRKLPRKEAWAGWTRPADTAVAVAASQPASDLCSEAMAPR